MQIEQSTFTGRAYWRAVAMLCMGMMGALAVPPLLGAAASYGQLTDLPGRQNPARSDTTITIHTEGSNLEFMPDRIAVRQGTRVTIRYVNDGTLPHNIVLVKNESDIDVLGSAAFQAKDTGYVPLAHEDRMIAYSELALPGETVEVTFDVPPAGEYFFVCLYPGHYNMMFGTLRSLR